MPDPRSTDNRPLIAAAIVGVVAIIATYVLLSPDAPSTTDGADAGARDRGACIPVVVSSSTEKGDLLIELARTYGRTDGRLPDGRCAEVRVHEFTSGKAMDALAHDWAGQPPENRPQVWTPTTSAWLDQLRLHRPDAIAETLGSIATSPVVLAMPEEMARDLRLQRGGGPIGWADIREEATTTGPWSPTHAEWGRFKLGKDHPRYSSSGLGALIGTYHAARVADGRSGPLDDADLDDLEVTSFVHDIETSVAHYNDDGTAFMITMAEESRKNQGLQYVSAIGVQEQLVYLYNRGSPSGDPTRLEGGPPNGQRLIALPPKDGTMVMDHPLAVLAEATPDQRAAAADFAEFLRTPAARQRFTELGFRDETGTPSPGLVSAIGLDPGSTGYTRIELPDARWVQRMLDAWNGVRRQARVLFVIDTSSSMSQVIDPDASQHESRLDRLKPAATRALAELSDADQVELWTFPGPGPAAGDNAFTRELAMTDLGTGRDALTRRITELKATGEFTPLHRVTREAQRQMIRAIESDRINAVVLLSDGENNDLTEDEPQLLRDIRAENLELSVRIFTVTYGVDDGFETMKRIAEATKARAFDARNPDNIEKALVSVFTTL